MDLVDDATNTTLARLRDEETIWAAAGALRAERWPKKSRQDAPGCTIAGW